MSDAKCVIFVKNAKNAIFDRHKQVQVNYTHLIYSPVAIRATSYHLSKLYYIYLHNIYKLYHIYLLADAARREACGPVAVRNPGYMLNK